MRQNEKRNPYLMMGVGFYVIFLLTKESEIMPEFLSGMLIGLSLTGYILYFVSLHYDLTHFKQWKKQKLCFWRKK